MNVAEVNFSWPREIFAANDVFEQLSLPHCTHLKYLLPKNFEKKEIILVVK